MSYFLFIFFIYVHFSALVPVLDFDYLSCFVCYYLLSTHYFHYLHYYFLYFVVVMSVLVVLSYSPYSYNSHPQTLRTQNLIPDLVSHQ